MYFRCYPGSCLTVILGNTIIRVHHIIISHFGGSVTFITSEFPATRRSRDSSCTRYHLTLKSKGRFGLLQRRLRNKSIATAIEFAWCFEPHNSTWSYIAFAICQHAVVESEHCIGPVPGKGNVCLDW